MSDYSYVFNAHPTFIESMYEKYRQDPASIEDGWRTFFQGFEFAANKNGKSESNGTNGSSNGHAMTAVSPKEFGVLSIIHGFRSRGHLLSTTNPIRQRRDRAPHLDLSDYNLVDADLNQVFIAGEEIGLKNATLQQIIDRLNEVYCGNLGVEGAHIENREKRMWLREKLESRPSGEYGLSIEKKKRILEKLNGAVGFENFLHTKIYWSKTILSGRRRNDHCSYRCYYKYCC